LFNKSRLRRKHDRLPEAFEAARGQLHSEGGPNQFGGRDRQGELAGRRLPRAVSSPRLGQHHLCAVRFPRVLVDTSLFISLFSFGSS